MDNSKEETSQTSNHYYEVQSRHFKPLSHCIIFDDSQLLITIGNDGQLNLYQRNHVKQYEHQTTCKMYSISQHSFDSPVVCYDIKQNSNCWKLILISLNNRIAACKIMNKKEIIVFRQMHFQQRNEQIVSCVWLGEHNEVVLGGLKGYIFILNLETRDKAVEFSASESKIMLARCKEDIFVGTKTSISKLELRIKISLQKCLQLHSEILDFTISQKDFFNYLVILTKDKIHFCYLEHSNLQKQTFSLKNVIETGKLGWNNNFEEIGVYLPLQEGTGVQVFVCNLNGVWSNAISK